MASKQVRAGKHYTFDPVGMDIWSPAHQGLTPGDTVKVVNLPGCPKANTMGHCHVEKDGQFSGLVLTNSLDS